jgi:hypothetical protein
LKTRGRESNDGQKVHTIGWHVIDVSTFPDLANELRRLYTRGHGPYRAFAFRGQANVEWPLRPTLGRELAHFAARTGRMLPSLPRTFEQSLLSSFRQKAHLYAPVQSLVRGDDDLEWMVLGRHYGLPTRLLDWSYSPFVAAWHACANYDSEDGAIWCVSVNHVNTQSPDGVEPLLFGRGEHLHQLVLGQDREPPITFFRPAVHNSRSAAQQGLFSISGDGEVEHAGLIVDVLGPVKLQPSETNLVLRVAKSCKREVMQGLRAMNVTGETLSPDLEGLCSELSQVIRDHPIEMDEMFRQVRQS